MSNVQDPVIGGNRREKISQKFAEGHAHGGHRPGLDDQKQSPSIEEAPERAQRFTQVNVLSAGLGIMAASSPYESAPTIVIKPVTSHAPISSAGELTSRAISADTIKMPEPIIDPMTRVVALVSPSPFTNSGAPDAA